MFDHTKVKLGRKPPRLDSRTLKLAHYIDRSEMPAAPAAVDNGAKVPRWGMLANDQLGDCTCAGILHAIMLWKADAGTPVSFTDADAIALYEKLCGYVPGHPNTDQGGVEIDLLNHWRKSPIQATKLTAYVAVNPADWEEVKLALYLFGTLYMGLALPISAQNETIWKSTKDAPGGWGGHCVVASKYDAHHLTCVTWGATKEMTPAWLAKYCDELYAPLSPAWFEAGGKAPNGFNVAQLSADLKRITA